jgi:glycosyltransferase involved in cell wall biosynthesis
VRLCFVVSDLTYPPIEGLHQQTVALINELRRSGLDVLVTGFCRDPGRFDSEAFLAETGAQARLFRSPPSRSSLNQGLRHAFQVQESELSSLIRKSDCDAIHLDGSSSAGLYRPWMRNAVISFVDPGSRRQWRLGRQTSSLLRKMKHAMAAGGYLALEIRLNRRGAVWHVVSSVDADHLRRRYRRVEIVSIPVMAPAALSSSSAGHTHPRKRPQVLIYGDLRQPHMAAGFIDIASTALTRPEVSGCDVTVLGRAPESSFRSQLPPQVKVTFIEWAPDPAVILRESDVVILPDPVGTGLKNRAIQAMAAGKLLIAMPAGLEGIPARHQVHALVAQSPDTVGNHLVRALTDPDIIPRLGAAGHELVRRHFDPRSVVRQWRDLYAYLSSCRKES